VLAHAPCPLAIQTVGELYLRVRCVVLQWCYSGVTMVLQWFVCVLWSKGDLCNQTARNPDSQTAAGSRQQVAGSGRHSKYSSQNARRQEPDRQTGRQADRQTGRQPDSQTGRQADRQTGRQADSADGNRHVTSVRASTYRIVEVVLDDTHTHKQTVTPL
jgi:hypothetical protein